MSLGFSALGQSDGSIRLVGAADVDEVSLATYARNFRVPAITRDVRQLASDRKALHDFLAELDDYDPNAQTVLIGCAPCQGFTAHRKKRWSKPDRRNGLVEAFADIAVRLKPSCVVMENVPELLSSRYWRHFEYFRDVLTRAGYAVKARICNAAEFGAPQERFRAIILAMRRPSFAMPRGFLNARRFLTVRQAIGRLPPVHAGEVCADDPYHRSANHRRGTMNIIRAIPKNGGSRPKGVGPRCLDRVKGFYDVYGRLHWDRPSITITHYARNPASGRFVHPEQDRGLTMREAARLQGFPDRFQFDGGFDDVFRQIGEAVAPPLALGVAAVVRQNLAGQLESDDMENIVSPVNDSYAGVIAGMKMARRWHC
jgi:DNA (cytosine-5)-methyltransferase 1